MSEPRGEAQKAKSGLVSELVVQGKVLGGFVGLLWLIQIVNAVVFQGALVVFGIHPRSIAGLLGILFAPFLHAGFAHLIANTLPLVVLGAFVMLRRKRDLAYVSLLSAVVGGLGTWLIAPAASVHVGASILIFGYLGFLLFRGIFERRLWPILGSIAVFFLYGGALFGVLPGQAGISWQGHLFGLLGGILAARLLRSEPEKAAAPKPAPARVARLAGAKARVATDPDEVDEEIEEELRARRRAR